MTSAEFSTVGKDIEVLKLSECGLIGQALWAGSLTDIMKTVVARLCADEVTKWRELVGEQLTEDVVFASRDRILEEVGKKTGGEQTDATRNIEVPYRGIHIKDIPIQGHLEEVNVRFMTAIKEGAVAHNQLTQIGVEAILGLKNSADIFPRVDEALLYKALVVTKLIIRPWGAGF